MPASPATPHVLSDYTHIGFDLDHTLARYKLDEFSPFLFGLLRDYIVAERGWPRSLLQLQFSQADTHKALIWDGQLGNILKLSADRSVLAASHGIIVAEEGGGVENAFSKGARPRMLSAAELREAYPTPLLDFDGSAHPRWHALYTFFETPCVPLVQAMVEATDRGWLSPSSGALAGHSPSSPYGHIFPAISSAYNFHLSSPDRGEYFPAFRKNPERFLHTRPEVKQWLKELRNKGVYLFLCTNSKMDYVSG